MKKICFFFIFLVIILNSCLSTLENINKKNEIENLSIRPKLEENQKMPLIEKQVIDEDNEKMYYSAEENNEPDKNNSAEEYTDNNEAAFDSDSQNYVYEPEESNDFSEIDSDLINKTSETNITENNKNNDITDKTEDINSENKDDKIQTDDIYKKYSNDFSTENDNNPGYEEVTLDEIIENPDLKQKIKEDSFYTKNQYIEENKNIGQNTNSDTINNDKLLIEENDLKLITVDENQKFYISIKDPGWNLKSMFPKLLLFQERDNKENNTLFLFQSGISGEVNLMFQRHDENNNILWRQPYKITVTSKNYFTIKENEETLDEDAAFFNGKNNEQENETEIDLKMNKENINQQNEEEDYRKNIANEFFNRRNYDEAEKIYLDLIKSSKTDSEIFYKMGIIEKNNKDHIKANDYFKNVLNDSESPYYYMALIELIKDLKEQKKYLLAVDTFYKYAFLTELDNNTAEDLNILLADLYFCMKDYRNARKEYTRFISRFPESGYYDKALFFLAYSIENLDKDADYKEAVRLYRVLTDEYPESRYYDPAKKRIFYLNRHYIKIN